MPLSVTLTANQRGSGSSSEAHRRLLVAPRTSGSSIPPSIQSYSAVEALQRAALQRTALPSPNQYTSAPSVALTVGEWQPQSSQATAALQAASEPSVLMSVMGFGIDSGHGGNSSWDATEASVRALRDAMERSTLRLPYLSSLSDVQLQMHVLLGVPPKQGAPLEPMVVDLASVTAVLPCSIPLLPIQIVVGGLAVPAVGNEEPPLCAAVASINIQSLPDVGGAPTATLRAMEQGPWAQIQEPPPPAARPAPAAGARRVDSMDMLARISEAVREYPDIVAGQTPLAAAIAAARSVEASSASDDEEEDDFSTESDAPMSKRTTSSAIPKKMLPPGLTSLKNERRFVEHNYHDHAYDLPNPGEELQSPVGDTIAFPFRMHDILSRMDADGYADVMSWMPHGRSFKIHDLDGFHEHILPVYFRHTKKSSLLRQLNLYGFRRISAGRDKGSYYHELFLRGKRFLCGRMRRQKVNGKRIRSAGNPETEPNFTRMTPMPPDGEYPPVVTNLHTIDPSLSSNMSEEEGSVEEDEPDPSPDEPYSYLSLSFPFKLHAMLDQLESLGKTDVLSWLPHGRAFRVHNPDFFAKEFMPSYFKMSKFSSFLRQLHIYSFQRLTSSDEDRGGYYHPQFLRGSPKLVVEMKRTRVNGKGCRKPADPTKEPDLHRLPPMPIIPVGSFVELPPSMPDPNIIATAVH